MYQLIKILLLILISSGLSAQTRSVSSNQGTSNGAPVFQSGPLGTPASGTLTSATGLPISTGVAGLGSGVATLLATYSSANARSAYTDENGTGVALFSGATTPDFTTGITIGGAGTSNKILKGNGTNYVPSTETYAAPGTAGNQFVSDGTNWTALNTRENWTSFAVTGSNATTTGQTLVDVTGLTSGTLSNSTLYEVEAWLNVTTSNVTTGCQYAITAGGSGGAAVVMAMLIGNSTGTTITTENIVASGTATSARLLTSSQSGMIYLHGWVTTRGSGTANISIQHLKVTSGTSTVLIGSKMKIRLAN